MNSLSTIRILCWPPLSEERKSVLASGEGGPFDLLDADSAESCAQSNRPDIDLVLLDAGPLPETLRLAEFATHKAVVLQFEADGRPDSAQDKPLAGRWSRAVEAGVQDILFAPDWTAAKIGFRLRAAAMRHKIIAQARNAYSTDLATGLPHRQQLLEHMNHLLALREREPAPMALLVLSVDGIATALQRLGVEAGRTLRRKLAVRLRSGLRASDVVAALEGENFAVLLSSVDNVANIDGVVSKLLASARRPFTLAGQPVSLDVNVGIGRYPEDGNDAATLLRTALMQATRQLNQGDLFTRQVHTGKRAANDDGLPFDRDPAAR